MRRRSSIKANRLRGRVSTLFTPNTADPTYPLDDMGRYAETTHYPPVDPASAANTLDVRDGFLGAAAHCSRAINGVLVV